MGQVVDQILIVAIGVTVSDILGLIVSTLIDFLKNK